MPISEAELPLTLPDMADFKPSGTPDPPLAKAADWVATMDPATGGGSGGCERGLASGWVLGQAHNWSGLLPAKCSLGQAGVQSALR